MSQGGLTPYLTVKGAKEAIAWYERVFDATCLLTMPADDGKRLMHATLSIDGRELMLSDEFEEFGGYKAPSANVDSPVAISLILENAADVDRIHALCVKEGGTSREDPQDMFWGDRFCMIVDPFGHRWMLMASLETDDAETKSTE